jgi:hypothetical protein
MRDNYIKLALYYLDSIFVFKISFSSLRCQRFGARLARMRLQSMGYRWTIQPTLTGVLLVVLTSYSSALSLR